MQSKGAERLSWGRSPGYEQPGDREKYKTSKAAHDTAIIAAAVLPLAGSGFALAGAFIGGVATAPVGGVGAPLGAGIGAAIGAVVGVGSAACDMHQDYEKFTASLDKEAASTIDNALFVTGLVSQDNRCAITDLFPRDPVKIRGEKQVYERAALEEHIKKFGNSPTTRRDITKADIEAYPQNFALVGIACDRVLDAPGAREKHSPIVLRGATATRKAMLNLASDQYNKEYKQIDRDAKSRKFPAREIGSRYTALSDIYDPILRGKASSSRVELDDDGCAVPLELAYSDEAKN